MCVLSYYLQVLRDANMTSHSMFGSISGVFLYIGSPLVTPFVINHFHNFKRLTLQCHMTGGIGHHFVTHSSFLFTDLGCPKSKKKFGWFGDLIWSTYGQVASYLCGHNSKKDPNSYYSFLQRGSSAKEGKWAIARATVARLGHCAWSTQHQTISYSRLWPNDLVQSSPKQVSLL